MGLSWLTASAREQMRPQDIADLVETQGQLANSDLMRYWNANQPIQSSWCRENYVEEQKQRRNDPNFDHKLVCDDFFLQRNIKATASYKGPQSLNQKREQATLERTPALFAAASGATPASGEFLLNYDARAR